MSPRYWQDCLANYPAVFNAAVERLLNSPNASERKKLFIGFNRYDGTPYLVPWEIARQHCHFLGDPGSNKTSKGLLPLIVQLIASGVATVVIIDLKGDMAMFQCARMEAERAGLPFKFFTTRVGWDSYIFNPLAQSYLNQVNLATRAEQMIVSLGLAFGEKYGASFFSSQQQLFTAQMLHTYGKSISSLRDLYRFSSDMAAYKGLGPQQDWQNSRHFHAKLHQLDSFALNAVARDVPDRPKAIENQIQVEEILKTPTVVYFFLQSPVAPGTNSSIARLFLYALTQGATLLQHVCPTVDTFVVMDEAQQLIDASFPLILNMARSLRISCLLSHQSLNQLRANDVDLTQTMLTSTAFKHIFRTSDLLSRDYLMKSGGEARYHDLSWKQELPSSGGGPLEQYLSPNRALAHPFTGAFEVDVRERVGPAMEPNTIMEVSADPSLSFVNMTEDRGPVKYQGRWTPIVSGYHQSEEDYLEAAAMPWPSGDPSCVTVPLEWPNTTTPPPPMAAGSADALNLRVQKSIDRKKKH